MARKEKTLADYLAIAVGPVLIMALVGSLVFFLLEVLYQGMHQGSLQWILFFFVFGAVLIARISMEAGISGRAAGYGLVLGLLVWLALLRFVDYPPGAPIATWGWAINLLLIAIIWWSAHRLTWDCTLIDDEVDASGTGLLQAAGFDKPAPPNPSPQVVNKTTNRQKDAPGLAGWWARYRSYRAERAKNPHSPGTWIVYFSLAALPLFGLGQAQIPLEQAERRASASWLFAIYVGSGLGLLLTTSFLGLRRYLRQRKLQMPATITIGWLSLGVVLIGALMLAGAFLPRPTTANPLWRWTGLTATEGEGSSWGRIGKGKEDKDGTQAGKKKAAKDDPNAIKQEGKKGELSDSKKEEQKGGGEDKGKGASDGKKDSDQSGKDKAGKDGAKKQDANSEPKPDAERSPSEPPAGQGLLAFLGKLLKWVVIIVVVLLVLYFGVRALLQFLSNFTHWARNLLAAWNSLFAWWHKRGQESQVELPDNEAVAPRPFASFHDPFVSGVAGRMSGAQLVRYTFEAMEAWARERDFGRLLGETPLEFAERAGEEAPAMEQSARRLSQLYVELAYARADLNAEGRENLRTFWSVLAEVAVRPLSAVGTVE